MESAGCLAGTDQSGSAIVHTTGAIARVAATRMDPGDSAAHDASLSQPGLPDGTHANLAGAGAERPESKLLTFTAVSKRLYDRKSARLLKMDLVAPLSWKKRLTLDLGVEVLKAVAEHQYVPPSAAVVFNARTSVERLAEIVDAESVVEC